MRELIVIPLVHVPFGVWKAKGLEAYFGKNPDPNIVNQIITDHHAYWDDVDDYLNQTSFDRIYQEGSFVEDGAIDFLSRYVIYKGRERSADTFFKLLGRGINFVRTESINAYNESIKRQVFEEPDELKPRDDFIAQTIDATLQDEERGVLFLGVSHGVDAILNERYSNIKAERFPKDPSYLVDLLNSITLS